ncbi:hypothetical protein SAMD00019534_013240 [Acytostelium subglobosum LB1]|uniref:hypothetical protein n=1 Tax=Acytostelium subglobosum LB1 TaxID=1410327 RepID=UPI000644E888|nr:hypothetical protein SAMD00019534_013240 [Acytostelium subglobosum LB1]GAM18149.1 hypothetical protein SAMD00019534_013240 [Acytostelium subglobosum LB1]|eukprot:XP_012758745.1 hypothetical protein SAMD00019534_013240 [Acytostelium subglobosum LB1]
MSMSMPMSMATAPMPTALLPVASPETSVTAPTSPPLTSPSATTKTMSYTIATRRSKKTVEIVKTTTATSTSTTITSPLRQVQTAVAPATATTKKTDMAPPSPPIQRGTSMGPGRGRGRGRRKTSMQMLANEHKTIIEMEERRERIKQQQQDKQEAAASTRVAATTTKTTTSTSTTAEEDDVMIGNREGEEETVYIGMDDSSSVVSSGTSSSAGSSTSDDVEQADVETDDKEEMTLENTVADYVACTHLEGNIDVQVVRDRLSRTSEWKCDSCSAQFGVFICLQCGVIVCSNYRRHLAAHNRQTGHLLMLDLQQKNCYCFQCNSYINNDTHDAHLDLLRKVLYTTTVGRGALSEEQLAQDDIEETAFNHYQVTLTRRVFGIWKTAAAASPSDSESASVDNHGSSTTSSLPSADAPMEEQQCPIMEKDVRAQMRDNNGPNDDAEAAEPDTLDYEDSPGKKRKRLDALQAPATSSEEQVVQNHSNNNSSSSSNKSYSSTYLMSKVASSPAKKNRIIPGVTGLRNLGNTCFMNTILQSLSNIPEFRAFFVQLQTAVGVMVDPLASSAKRQSTIDCLNLLKKHKITHSNLSDLSFSVQLHYLFRVLWSGKWSVVTPSSLLESVWKFIPKFKYYQQQDAQEFFSYLLDCISQELNPKSQRRLSAGGSSQQQQQVVPNSSYIIRPFTHRKKKRSSLPDDEYDALIAGSMSSPPSVTTPPITSPSLIMMDSNIEMDSPDVNRGVLTPPIMVPGRSSQSSPINMDSMSVPSTPPAPAAPHKMAKQPAVPEKDDGIVSKIFQGKLKSEITCLKCSNKASVLESFLELTLDVPGGNMPPRAVKKRGPKSKKTAAAAVPLDGVVEVVTPPPAAVVDVEQEPAVVAPPKDYNLEQCIRQLVQKEKLDGKTYKCSHCNELQDAEKKFSLLSLPNVLCIVLKRFRWRENQCSKIETEVTFPFEIDLSPYVEVDDVANGGHHPTTTDNSDSANANNNNNNKDNNKDNIDNIDIDNKDSSGSNNGGINNSFELLNVINHHGSGLLSGHYTAFCFNDLQEIWVHYNDSKVTIVEANDVIESSKCSAYILFYQRKGTSQSIQLDLEPESVA